MQLDFADQGVAQGDGDDGAPLCARRVADVCRSLLLYALALVQRNQFHAVRPILECGAIAPDGIVATADLVFGALPNTRSGLAGSSKIKSMTRSSA
ncbi:hypothetical protein [Janthinobacterium sp. HLS12-2]|uniref:hypothetical protein n=1 Tax=Janthinobacterium sp. HLS12-2 TaxID=1259324 RepID=UPI003F29D3DA